VDAAALKAFFDAHAATWDRSAPDPAGLERIAALSEIGPGMDVLDIACGTGAMFRAILARNPRRLVAIDLSDAMIRRAASRCSDPRLTLIAGDFYQTPAETFDRAVAPYFVIDICIDQEDFYAISGTRRAPDQVPSLP